MPHPRSARTASLLLLTALVVPAAATAQAEPPSPASAPATTAPAAPAAPALTPPAPGASPVSPANATPTPAQQAVLEKIRRLRDGNQRRFGSCSYRWDSWKLHADGTRTTTYSCEGTPIVDRTIGVNCSKLQINSYDPLPAASGKGEGWAWGSWRLPQPGGEEQMVATLCANALPPPPTAPATTAPAQPPATKTPASAGKPPAGSR